METLNRREFCKLLGATGVAVIIPGGLVHAVSSIKPRLSADEITYNTLQAGTNVHYSTVKMNKSWMKRVEVATESMVIHQF